MHDPRFRVRPAEDGFAVFGTGSERISEIHPTLDRAIAEAEALAGEGEIVLVESQTGHIVREIHCTRLR